MILGIVYSLLLFFVVGPICGFISGWALVSWKRELQEKGEWGKFLKARKELVNEFHKLIDNTVNWLEGVL